MKIESIYQQQRRHSKGISKKYHLDRIIIDKIKDYLYNYNTLENIKKYIKEDFNIDVSIANLSKIKRKYCGYGFYKKRNDTNIFEYLKQSKIEKVKDGKGRIIYLINNKSTKELAKEFNIVPATIRNNIYKLNKFLFINY